MENKYYTPDISEFHVGFEYERKTSSGWAKSIFIEPLFNDSNICQGFGADKKEWFSFEKRVKYLDREDIESLGFEHDQSTKDGSYFYSGTLITENQWCIILKDFTIDIYDINGKSDFRFSGLVKNKSELKQILKMIGYAKN